MAFEARLGTKPSEPTTATPDQQQSVRGRTRGQRAGLRVGAALLAAGAALGFTNCGEGQPSPQSEIKNAAVTAATSILDDMATPRVGIENYERTLIGNRKAIAGPDQIFGTYDDRDLYGRPQMVAKYYPETGKIFLASTLRKGEGYATTFTQEAIVFSVDKNSPIKKDSSRQLTLVDFRRTVRDKNTDLQAIRVAYRVDYGVAFGKDRETVYKGLSPNSLLIYDALVNRSPADNSDATRVQPDQLRGVADTLTVLLSPATKELREATGRS